MKIVLLLGLLGACRGLVVNKCCPRGQTLGKESCVTSKHPLLHPFRPPPIYRRRGQLLPNATYEVAFGRLPKCRLLYYLEPQREPGDVFWLLSSGTVVRVSGDPLPPGNYCLEAIPQQGAVLPVLCFPEGEEEGVGVFAVYPVGMLVSIPFLAATLVVYTFFRELGNLHGRCLVCHVTCLLIGYSLLATIQIDTTAFPYRICLVMEPGRSAYNKYLRQGALVLSYYRRIWYRAPRTTNYPPGGYGRSAFLSRKRHCTTQERRWGAVMAGQPWARLVLYCLVRSVAGVVLPKCCPLGESFLIGSSGAECSPDDGVSTVWDIRLYSRSSPPLPLDVRYDMSHNPLPCTQPGSRTIHDDQFWIYPDGSIEREGIAYDPKKRYCLEFFINFNVTYPVFCAAKDFDEPKERYFMIGIGFFVSVPFALATVIVYLFIKELQSLHGRIVIFNMSSFIVASILMGMIDTRIIKSYESFDIICGIAGYAIQFFFMATFFWLNVMCFDIYWAFSGLRNLTGSVKERERKKLIVYSVYAWCTPLLILVITVAVDLSPGVPVNSFFKPRVGEDKCFFKEKGATWIYFYLPMALIILSNIILFGITAFRIWSHRRETAVLKRGDSRKHDSTNDKESLVITECHEEQLYLPWYSGPKTSSEKYLFTLYLKLFIVMGINWVMELLSSILGGPSYLWYIPDFTNTLQGLFIFLIFVWKKRVRRLVWARLRSCCKKETISSGPRTTWSGASSRNTNSTNSTNGVNNSIKMNPGIQASQTTLA